MPTIDTSCPDCGAPHARRISLIYVEGQTSGHELHQYQSKTKSVLPVKIETTGASTTSTQSHLSQQLAPPPSPNPIPQSVSDSEKMGVVFGIALAAGVGVCVWLWDVKIVALFFGALTAILVFLIGSGVFRRPLTPVEQATHQQTSDAAKAELDRWNQSFLCMVCGTKFVPALSKESISEPENHKADGDANQGSR